MKITVLWKKVVRKYWIQIVLMGGLIGIEFFLRFAFGLGNPVLLQADPTIGYLFQSNQKVIRFGNRIEYNQYHQRSSPITYTKPPGVFRILMIGDSVLNGGAPIDQSETISSLLQTRLKADDKVTEVLNASAGSWGLGNELAYLDQFGTFNSDLIILQIGVNDLAQQTSTGEVVDHHPSYPSKRPVLALQEVFTRYIWTRLEPYFIRSSPTSKIHTSQELEAQAKENRQFLAEIITKAHDNHQPIVVIFMPELEYLVPEYKEPTYKTELLNLLARLSVPSIDFQVYWSNKSPSELTAYFRDGIHPSEVGNQEVSKALYRELCQQKFVLNCSTFP